MGVSVGGWVGVSVGGWVGGWVRGWVGGWVGGYVGGWVGWWVGGLPIAMGRGIRIHVYADDTQIYVRCAASDRQPAATRLLVCVSEIESWMSSNRLKLNASKTEFIWIGTRRQLSKVEEEALMVGGQSITPMVKARDLGVYIDRELTMEAHVSNTVRGCMYQLRQLRSVKRSLTLDSRRALATAFVAIVVSTTATVFYTVSRKKFSDFKWF